MSFQKIKSYINDAVFAFFGIVDVLLVLRIILKLIAASEASSFVKMIYSATNGFASTFTGTLGNIPLGRIVFEVDTIIAIFVYFAVGLGLFRLLDALLEHDFKNQMRLGLDTLLKIMEVSLGLRLFFKLVGAGDSRFIKILYSLSDVFFKPFEGLSPSIGADKFIFETATLVAIIILIIIDVTTENLFKEMKSRHDAKKKEEKVPDSYVKTAKVESFQNTSTIPTTLQPQITPVAANIEPTTIQPTAQPTYTPIAPAPLPAPKKELKEVEKILMSKKGQSAIMDIDNLLSPTFYKNPNLLTRAERNIVLIEEFEREVNNGGFHQFFINSAGGFANETLSALTAVGSQFFTRLLSEAISVFPGGAVPKVNEIRRSTIASIEMQAAPIWNRLDTEFYKYEEDIYGLMIKYIEENIENFR